jgi:kynurenine formamidase
MTEPDVLRATAKIVSNWGRWGDEDERGTLNLIGPEELIAAARLVRRGAIFSLAAPLHGSGPQEPGGLRINPLHFMTAINQGSGDGPLRFNDDYLILPLQASTQWDSLSHVHYDDLLYNGYPAESITVRGASRNDIAALQPGIVGRGVLLDIARFRAVPYLQAGEAIHADELEVCARAQGVQVRAGDILLVRTGWWGKYAADGLATEFKRAEPGLGMDTVEWLRRRDVAAVAADNYAVEVLPGEDKTAARLILHLLLIRDMGMPLGEIFDLEELAADCADDGVYEFLFTAPPLLIPGAGGSPVTPLAVK